MTETSLSRRTFIRNTSAAAIALGAPRKILGANDAIALGIIGTGGRGQRLLKAITRIPDFRVAAVCDLVEDRMDLAAEICEQYDPKVKKYLDFRKMLSDEKLDACIVATEEANHAKCVIPVLDAGLHCFSEKPMDVTVEKVDQVTRAARKAKGIYQIGFQRHYVPTFQSAIKHIHDGGVGKVTFMQGMWHWEGGVGGRYLDMDLSGCWFLAQACHHADVMAWVMNTHPLRCEAVGAITVDHKDPPEHCAEDHSTLIFQFPNNAIFSYTHIMYCPKEFTGEKLWVYAEKGGIDLPKGMKYPRSGMGEPERLGEEVPDWDAGTSRELEAFAHHIQNNEKPLADVEVGRLGTLVGIMGGQAMYNRRKKVFEP
ncbi:MAG: Gfo/Idh/MocA family oxidoreductase, partial [bacterium]